jgi:hypothetical protein
MSLETMTWINTLVLIVAAIVIIPVVTYGFATMQFHLKQARGEGGAHASRLAAILEHIDRRL